MSSDGYFTCLWKIMSSHKGFKLLKKSSRQASTHTHSTLTTCKHSQPWSGYGTPGNDLQVIQPGWRRGGHHIYFLLFPPPLTIMQLTIKRSKEEVKTTAKARHGEVQ